MNAEPLDLAVACPDLGRTVTYNNSNWAALYHIIWKKRRWWGVVGKVVTNAEATVQAQGNFYKAIMQFVLLYVGDNWVVTGTMINLLEGFHHQAAMRILEMMV